jgi:hypothetical protein
LITVGAHDSISMGWTDLRFQGRARSIVCAIGLGLCAAGCVPAGGPPTAQFTTPGPTKTTAVVPAPGAAPPAAVKTTASAPKAAAPTKTVTAAPKTKTKTASGGSAAAPAASASAAPAAAADPSPAPAAAAPPTTASTDSGAPEPLPGAPAAPASGKVTYPNINVQPAEPGGTLLPPDQRAKMIGELEALKNRQGTPPPASDPAAAASLRAAGANHGADAIKAIEKCSDPTAAASDPDCKPPAD